MYKLVVIVLNYNNFTETTECISSIFSSTDIKLKIIIIDNKSTDNSVNMLRNLYWTDDRILLFSTPMNKGYSYGNNFGIEEAKKLSPQYIMISNPDVIYHKFSIDSMIKKLSKNPDVAIIGPKVLDLNGEIQSRGKKNLSFKRYLSSKKPFIYFFKKTYNEYTNRNTIDVEDKKFFGMVSGCSFILKPDIFERINCFDDNTFLYFEEDIIGIKLFRIGYKVMIDNNSVVTHKGSTAIKGNHFIDYHLYSSGYYALVKYIQITHFQRSLVKFINIGAFILKSIVDKQYKKHIMALIKNYKRIEKEFIDE